MHDCKDIPLINTFWMYLSYAGWPVAETLLGNWVRDVIMQENSIFLSMISLNTQLTHFPIYLLYASPHITCMFRKC